jgi:hypothetical protein
VVALIRNAIVAQLANFYGATLVRLGDCIILTPRSMTAASVARLWARRLLESWVYEPESPGGRIDGECCFAWRSDAVIQRLRSSAGALPDGVDCRSAGRLEPSHARDENGAHSPEEKRSLPLSPAFASRREAVRFWSGSRGEYGSLTLVAVAAMG